MAHHPLRGASIAAALAVGALAAAALTAGLPIGLSPAEAVPPGPSAAQTVQTAQTAQTAARRAPAPAPLQLPGFRAAPVLGVPPAVDAAVIAARAEALVAAAEARREALARAELARQEAERRREERRQERAAARELARLAADMVGVQESLYRGRYFVPEDEDVRQCIVKRESEGYYSVVDPTGTWFGAYQFARGTSDVAAQRMGRWDLVGVPANRWNRFEQDTAFWVMWDFGSGRQHWAGGRWYC